MGRRQVGPHPDAEWDLCEQVSGTDAPSPRLALGLARTSLGQNGEPFPPQAASGPSPTRKKSHHPHAGHRHVHFRLRERQVHHDPVTPSSNHPHRPGQKHEQDGISHPHKSKEDADDSNAEMEKK